MATLRELGGYGNGGGFDAGQFIQLDQAGQRQRTLSELGQQASQGDFQGAERTAWAGGQTDIASQLRGMNQQDHQQLVQDTASFALSADTPEKWQAMGQQFAQAHPGFDIPPFQARQALIDRAVPVAEKLRMQQAQSNADREYGLEKQKLDQGNAFGAAGSEVPLGPDGKADPLAQKDFLAKLDPGTASLVKSIADYQMDISKVTSLRGDQRQKLAQIVSQYDPTFDMTQYGARAAMRKSITSGPYSQALNSANLVIQHLDALKRAIPDLGNGSLQPYNSVKNFLLDQGGSAAISKFNTAADAAASELAKVFKGTGASSEEEIKNWRHNLSINGSPDQIKQSIETAIGDLLKSRIDTINSQYQAAMGRPASFTFLTPHSRQVLKDIGIDPASLDPNVSDDSGTPAQNAGGGGWKIEPVQ